MALLKDAALLGLGLGIAGYRRVRGLLVPVPSNVTALPVRDGRSGSPQRSRSRAVRAFDGAQGGYRGDGWLASGTDVNAEVLGGLARLRDRSRDLVRNNANASRAVRSLTSNLIGSGIRPLPNTGDEDLDKRITALWDSWSRVCYPSNRSTIYTLESLIARSFFESGEVFVRLRPRRAADMPAGVPPLQLQVLEGDHVPLDDLMFRPLANGNRVEQGVEFNGVDQRVAYHMYRVHPGSTSLTRTPTLETVRVPATSVIHCYQELRPGQIRGIPWLSPVILSLWDLGGYQDAERVRARAAALIAAFVEGGEPADPGDNDPENDPDGVGIHTDGAGQLVTDSRGQPVEDLVPGMVAYLPTGKSVKLNTPGTPGGYAEYVRAHLHEIAAGTGLSYEIFTSDLSQTNFSSIKLGLNEQHRMIRALREQTFNPFVMDPIYEAFCDAAIAVGLLPDVPEVYKRTWSRPLIESIDRKADAEAAEKEARAGFRSRREIIASDYSRDPDEVDEDIRLGNERIDKAGLVLDSDPRMTGKSGSAPPTAPQTPPAE